MNDQNRLFHLFKIAYHNFELLACKPLFRDILICIEQVEIQLEIVMSDEQLLTVMRHTYHRVSTSEFPADFGEIDEEIKYVVIITAGAILHSKLAKKVKEAAAILPKHILEEVFCES